jgi:3-deoxy-manno-octulosonate cytidylyltransferase (CMP-KDO synthetase)
LAIVAIIPARFGSTRLPGKPLSDIHGKPMVQHVYERASHARLVDRVLVATDDNRVVAAVRGFGGEVTMTASSHRSGTDRLAEAAEACAADVIVNVQGDEPMIDPRWIDQAIGPLLEEPGLSVSTLSLPLSDLDEMMSPSVVKVVTDGRGNALYFSRSPIPHVRLDPPGDLAEAAAAALERGLARKHVGLYVYRREALLRFARLPPSPLEAAEGLEQLRALQDGMRIRVVEHEGPSGVAVDTPEDLERVRGLMAVDAAPLTMKERG